jgi:phage baseplate assembly protein W
MAYRIEPILDTFNTATPLGIKLSFNDVGIFSTNYNSTDQAKANLRNLILTKVGERYEQPTFGCNLLNILFQPMSDDIIGNINEIIQTPVSYWLPYISIENIDVKTNLDDIIPDHTIKITIKYTVPSAIETQSIIVFAGENGILKIE